MNLHHQFYRAYYQHFDPSKVEDKDRKKLVSTHNARQFKTVNQRITNAKLDQIKPKDYLFTKARFGQAFHSFSLQTTYPGLLTGTGYPHETGGADDEFKIGFYFDQTTGLPTLPGSSIKGILRAHFPRSKMQNQNSEEPPEVKQSKADFIVHCLAYQSKNETLQGWHKAGESQAANRLNWVTKLERQIFEGADPAQGKKRLAPSRTDAFLDAQIAAGPASDQAFMGTDYITPHGEKIWQEPTPLLFLKVLPQVDWQFSFLLHDTSIEGIKISAELKEQLIRLILLFSGVGAKTNVGYGRLIDASKQEDELRFLEDDCTSIKAEDTTSKGNNFSTASSQSGKTQNPKPTTTPQAAASGPTFSTKQFNAKKSPFTLNATVIGSDYKGCEIEVWLNSPKKQKIYLTGTKEKFAAGTHIKVDCYFSKKGKLQSANYKSRY
ncbi:MAG: type III-B CRISPR module RAMP protein Cmr6 [Bacteroidota bacterium]